jgi:hypothetical protein
MPVWPKILEVKVEGPDSVVRFSRYLRKELSFTRPSNEKNYGQYIRGYLSIL